MMDELDENGLPVRFQISFVTADRKKKTGGEIIEVKGARKCVVGNRNGKPVFDTREKAGASGRITRPPNHWANSTRNIILPNGGIRTVHIRLIIEFNNKKVFF